jgi:UDP-galactopyranose mutase
VRNASTRFLNPVNTNEYLAAGCPVVATPLADIVQPYGQLGLLRLANTPEDFVAAGKLAMRDGHSVAWRRRVEKFLATRSWEDTFLRMSRLEGNALAARETVQRLVQTARAQRIGA